VRQIKFRGKTKYGSWVYGYYFLKITEEGKPIHQIIENYSDFNRHNPGMKVNFHQVIPETVGQFIGSKDENGNKMYEGDIVDYWNPNGDYVGREVIEYRKGTGYEIRTPFVEEYDLTTIGWAIKDGYKFEIIGNKSENPELLKEE
jgi:uncharacterized phage protein (TIGR01671 family)